MVAGPWWFGALGFAVAFPIHFALWRFAVNKGGDAKLMIGIGAMYGWAEVLEATAWELILFGPLTLIWVGVRGDWANWWQAQKYALAKSLGPLLKALPIASLQNLDLTEEPKITYVPKAPFIAAAVLIGRYTDILQVFAG
jgi:Flp pilus assembly protein protease CpaA